MKNIDGTLRLSASDLAHHLACHHLTGLTREVANGTRQRSHWRDAEVQALAERGEAHEREYLNHLEAKGLQVLRLDERGGRDAFDQTVAAMRRGVDVLAQATLISGRWLGVADVLRRVDAPSDLGNWSYEVVDTKLARETKGGTILQLSLYSEIVGEIQGRLPDAMHVVSPGEEFEPETFRVLDHLAYHRHVKRRLEQALDGDGAGANDTPEPCEHCDVCDWRWHCDQVRRANDHLSLVAGISRLQRLELVERGVTTLAGLARMPIPMEPRPRRGAQETYERVREQARVQLEMRESGQRVHERLPVAPARGLARLPEPSPGDVFLDFEGDRYVGDGGLEFLFGVLVPDEQGTLHYQKRWARNRAEEKAAFEWLIDLVLARWERHPGMHVYHYGVYEKSTLKRLMGRHATREDELDRILRAERLVDLHATVKEALRASVERYSIKDLEPFFGFERELDLEDARRALRSVQHALEYGDPRSIDADTMAGVEAYNRDDCVATLGLRDWLEELRTEAVAEGLAIERPELKDGDPAERLEEDRTEVQELVDELARDVPVDPEERTEEQAARWLLAQLLEWHRRENKAAWWEHFRLHQDVSDEDLADERHALTGLVSEGQVGKVKRSELHRFRFPDQELSLSVGDDLETREGQKLGSVEALDLLRNHVDVKMTKKGLGLDPSAVFFDSIVPAKAIEKALRRLGHWVADHGVDEDGPYRAARDLLLRRAPRRSAGGGAGPLRRDGEDGLDAAKRLALELDHGTLPIQGPPGTGKTYTGARMITELVRAGKRVGVSALGHKAIQNLLVEVADAARQAGEGVRILRKGNATAEDEAAGIAIAGDNKEVDAALADGEVDVVGGTPWLWSREELFESVDVLFVDEAGQLSLANVLAIGQAAANLVLLGDPQQLEQPLQGSHPEGAEVSALEHVLGDEPTIDRRAGLLLETTFRMHERVCSPISELFYAEQLSPHESVERVRVLNCDLTPEPGILMVPVEHRGNSNGSLEEVEAVVELVRSLTGPGVTWRDRKGIEQPLTLDDVLVVAPFNVQVGNLQRALPDGARVGTVDKFQGQEAPVVIFSLTTSTPDEAPRGMEFLYSPNRLNVALSRARCNAIVVASPALFEPQCRTPGQIRLANAFCRLMEVGALTSRQPV